MKNFSLLLMHIGLSSMVLFGTIEYGTGVTNNIAQSSLAENFESSVSENIETESSFENNLEEAFTEFLLSESTPNSIPNVDSESRSSSPIILEESVQEELIEVIDNSNSIAELQSQIDVLLPELDVTIELLELLPIEYGTPVAKIVAPSVGIDDILVEGVQIDDLREGPGIFPGSPAPGGVGNLAIAGHRTTYGSPFGDLDDFEAGDRIEIFDDQGWKHVYIVTAENGEATSIVNPNDFWVTFDKGSRSTLTLIACHPKRSAAQRIVVNAELLHSIDIAQQYEDNVINSNNQVIAENEQLTQEQIELAKQQNDVRSIIRSLQEKIRVLQAEELSIGPLAMNDIQSEDDLLYEEVNLTESVEEIEEELVNEPIDIKSLSLFAGSASILWVVGASLLQKYRLFGASIYVLGFVPWVFVGFPLAAAFGI